MRFILSLPMLISLGALMSAPGCAPTLDVSAIPPSESPQAETSELGPPMFAALGPGFGGNGAAIIIMDAAGGVIRRVPTGNDSSPWEEWSMTWYPDTGVFLVSDNSDNLWSVEASTGEVVEYGAGGVVVGGVARTARLPDGGVLLACGSALHQTNADEEIVQTWEYELEGTSWVDIVAHADEGVVLLENGQDVRVFATGEGLGRFAGFVDSIGQDGGGALWGTDTFGSPVGWFEPGGPPQVLGEPADLGLLRKALAFEPLGEESVWVLSADGYDDEGPNSKISVLTRTGDVTDLFETDEWWLDFAVVTGLELGESEQ